MRVDLRDGQWAELRERITHAQDKEIRRSRARVRQDPTASIGDSDTVALRVFVKAWHVLDVDGNPLPLDADDAMERLPMDIADELVGEIIPLYTGATVPNAPTPDSSADSSSASG